MAIYDLIGFLKFNKAIITMHVSTILQQLLSTTIHKSRVESLKPVIKAIITSKTLRLTELGRSLQTPGQERSAIRRMDRLLANPYYQAHFIDFYKAIISSVLSNLSRPIILVDWTGIPNSRQTARYGEHSALRASLIAEGRSITLYEEVHSKKKENNDEVHKAFLHSLKSILPNGCRPYMVTDAGFKNPWFRAVVNLGWDYIGRVRGTVHYDDGSGFKSIDNLFTKATQTPTYCGEYELSKTTALKTNFYIYKHKLVGRQKLTKGGKRDRHKDSENYARGYRQPWVLVSSLKGFSAVKRVVKIYKYRMTIESSFRDTKSTQFGFSMNNNVTLIAKRYTVWLLIGTLASLIAWIVGYVAEQKKLHYEFQANTYRHRRVLSFFYLGCQVIRKNKEFEIELQAVRQTAWDEVSWGVLC